MQIINHENWRYLKDAEAGTLLSIHMPTHEAGPETRQNPILFKNLLSQAQTRLIGLGLNDSQIHNYLVEARSLLGNSDFWQHQKAGLAVFADGVQTHLYRGQFTTRPSVVTAPRFHLIPLIDIFEHDTDYYILALSASQARLYRVTADQIEPIEIQGAPANLREAMGYDDPQRQLQFHTGTAPQSEPASGTRPAVFHGHGVGTDHAREKQRLHEYCRMLNAGLIKALAGTHAPLVIAATEPLLSIFRQQCIYPGLTAQSIEGSPEPINENWLVKEGNHIFSDLMGGQKREAIQAYEEVAGTPKASADPTQVLTAAHDGRVQTLLVTADPPLWGAYDRLSRDMTRHADQQSGSEGIKNLAAIMTLRNDGDVVVLHDDQSAPGLELAAVFRYAAA